MELWTQLSLHSYVIFTPHSPTMANCPVPLTAVTENGYLVLFFISKPNRDVQWWLPYSLLFFWSIDFKSNRDKNKKNLFWLSKQYQPEILKTQLHRTSLQYPSTLLLLTFWRTMVWHYQSISHNLLWNSVSSFFNLCYNVYRFYLVTQYRNSFK